MTQCISQPQLEAFHDGELSPSAAKAVAEHLQSCTRCSAELSEIRKISAVMGGERSIDSQEMTDIELERLHIAVDQVIARTRHKPSLFRCSRR